MWRDLLGSMETRLDEDLLPVLYAAVSLPTAQVRAELDKEGLAWSGPDRHATLTELDRSAEQLIAEARKKAGAIGAAGGLAGAVGVPPELLASLVHSLRLAQRLAVVYGFDPDTDRGQIVLWRALAAAYQLELPEGESLKVRELPGAAANNLPTARRAAAWMGRRVIRRSISQAVFRAARLVPGLATGLSARSAWKLLEARARRMQDCLRRASEAAPGPLLEVVEAEVVREGP